MPGPEHAIAVQQQGGDADELFQFGECVLVLLVLAAFGRRLGQARQILQRFLTFLR